MWFWPHQRTDDGGSRYSALISLELSPLQKTQGPLAQIDMYRPQLATLMALKSAEWSEYIAGLPPGKL
jgi:hypothetical protein